MTRRLVVAAAVVAAAAGGGGFFLLRSRAVAEEPRLPYFGGIEPAVVEKVKSLHAAVMADRGAVDAWSRYARTLHAHDMGAEAEHAYAAAAGLVPPAERFELLYLAGCAVIRIDPERARGWMEQALELRSDYVPLHLRLGELHEKARRFEDAKKHYRRAFGIQASSEALAGEGRALLAEGSAAEAVAVLERARDLDPEHREVHAALAAAYARCGRREDAARASAEVGDLAEPRAIADPILTAMRREGVAVKSLERLGLGLMKGRNPKEALAAFDRALALAPQDLDLQTFRARALSALQRFDEAVAALEPVLARRPDDVEALAMKAIGLAARGDRVAAVPLFRKVLALDPRHDSSRYNLACLMAEWDPAEAKKLLSQLLARRPGRTDARLMLARLLAGDGRKGEAAAEVERILAMDPQHAGALKLRRELEGR